MTYKQINIALSNWVNKQLLKVLPSKRVFKTLFNTERKFYCESNTEIFRTVKFGGEITSLGAFLFLLKPDDIVWDIGASVGLYSIYSTSIVSQVFSFEPDPKICSRLQENVALNQLEHNITSINEAIGKKQGVISLHSDGLKGNSPSLSQLNRHSNTIEVKVDTIDNLISKTNSHPSVLKIDIEGAEILALKGGSELLSSIKKPRMIFMELHPKFLTHFNSSEQECLDLLQTYGYQIISFQKRSNEIHIIAIPS